MITTRWWSTLFERMRPDEVFPAADDARGRQLLRDFGVAPRVSSSIGSGGDVFVREGQCGTPFCSLHADAYDALITDPVEAWIDAIHDRLVRTHRPQALILDAGCGTGRHAAALIAKGHQVDVADGSRELLARAKNVALPPVRCW